MFYADKVYLYITGYGKRKSLDCKELPFSIAYNLLSCSHTFKMAKVTKSGVGPDG
jgi:hypothetical protein